MAVTKITRNGIVGFASALVQTTEANAGDNLLLNASDGNATNVNGSILSETDNAILVLKSHGSSSRISVFNALKTAQKLCAIDLISKFQS